MARKAVTEADYKQQGLNGIERALDVLVLFSNSDSPTLGVTAFPHDPTPLPKRVLDVGGEATPFGAQFAFPGLATFPMLPATSFPIGFDPDGLPIGVQAIADTYLDHKAIAVARLAKNAVELIVDVALRAILRRTGAGG